MIQGEIQGSKHVNLKHFILKVNAINWEQVFSVFNRFFLLKMSSTSAYWYYYDKFYKNGTGHLKNNFHYYS